MKVRVTVDFEIEPSEVTELQGAFLEKHGPAIAQAVTTAVSQAAVEAVTQQVKASTSSIPWFNAFKPK